MTEQKSKRPSKQWILITPELHKEAKVRAAQEGMTLTAWCERAVRSQLQSKTAA